MWGRLKIGLREICKCFIGFLPEISGLGILKNFYGGSKRLWAI